MKKLFLISIALSAGLYLYAQVPVRMSYQAVVRGSSSQLIKNTTIGMKISILQGSATGTPVYEETQTPQTNVNGLVTIEIGDGNIVLGSISAINWANGPYHIKTETDLAGGANYTLSGTSQLLSVPYALQAQKAESATETDPVFGTSVAHGISGSDVMNWNNKLSAEIDGSVTNEIQTISRAGLTVTLSKGGGAYTDSINIYTAGAGINITNNVISAIPGHYQGELYGGGVVFFVDQSGEHGLICSMIDQESMWSNIFTIGIGTSAQSDWDGQGNTNAIINQPGHTSSAAKICVDYINIDYGTGVFNDWYLPALAQLQKLYNVMYEVNKTLDSDGNSATTSFLKWPYWSSTENSSFYAWTYHFYYQEAYTYEKASTWKVRAIRSF